MIFFEPQMVRNEKER